MSEPSASITHVLRGSAKRRLLVNRPIMSCIQAKAPDNFNDGMP